MSKLEMNVSYLILHTVRLVHQSAMTFVSPSFSGRTLELAHCYIFFPHPRLEHWRKLVCARAIENQTYFIAANQSGVEDHGSGLGEAHYFGHSMVVDPWGEIVTEANEDECLLQVEIDLSNVNRVRKKLSAWDDRRTDVFS